MVNLARPYIGLFPIFLLVALMVAFGLFTGQATREGRIAIDHTHAVILDLKLELEGVLNAETGQRGFLLSENDSYLMAYDLGRSLIATTNDQLRQDVGDNPDQMVRLRDLQGVIAGKLDELSQTITLAKAGHRDEAIALVRTNAGRTSMLDIRQRIAAMTSAEQVLLAHRQAEAEKTRGRVQWATYTGAAGAALSAMVLFMTLSRDQKRRAAAAVQLVRLKDEAQAANTAKSDFLATMSHEIRTPMNGIIGMNGLLLDTPLDQQQEQFAKGVQVSADALLKVVNDILDISKLEAGRVEIEAIDFAPATLIESALDGCAIPAQQKGLEIAALIDPNVPGWVRGDPARLRQVVLNLIGNAVKFTSTGYIEIQLSALQLTENGGLLRVTITDTGIGIPEKARAQLFEKFVQADTSITRRYGGTGLGLAISKQLVTLMGGTIGADSTVGEGTRFWFTARFGKAQSAPTGATFAQPALLKGRRVVVVDDTALNLRAIAGQMESCGIAVTTLADPGSLLAELRTAAAEGRAYDIAVIDQNMPEISGITLARGVRAVQGFDDLKLILATSVGLPNPSDDARHVGFDDYLAKPLKRATLIASLCKVLGLESAAVPTGNGDWVATETTDAGVTLNILVAEDNMINQRLIMVLLQKWGHTVTVVDNGFAAVTAAAATDYDVILMDIQMPGMSGIEAAMRIRQSLGPRSMVPIIALTAHVMAGVREDAMAAGIDDYVTKPIDPMELTLAINRLTRTFSSPSGPSPQNRDRRAKVGADDVVADPSGLDEELLNRLEGQIGKPMVAELAGMLLEQTPDKLAEIHTTLEAGDTATARQLAHDLASTAGNLGITTVVMLARELERKSNDAELESLPSIAIRIDAAYHAAAASLRERYGVPPMSSAATA
jgi:signal transduction histidine kinase/DNA-binding response OmpR family regulator